MIGLGKSDRDPAARQDPAGATLGPQGPRGGPTFLDRHRESFLINRAQNGDRVALEDLIRANLRLIQSVARGFHCRSHTLDDLVQEGVLGFIAAVHRFDTSRGFRLSTYAVHWVRQSITRAVQQSDRIIHIPMHASAEMRRVARTREELHGAIGQPPSDVELSAATGLSEERLSDLQQSPQDPISLDCAVAADDETLLAEFSEDPDALDPEQHALQVACRHLILDLIGDLRQRERLILEGRFGLRGGATHTLDQLSRQLRISRERVRQIEAQAIRRLRAALRESDWA